MEHLEAIRQHIQTQEEEYRELEELCNKRITDLEDHINKLQDIIAHIRRENREKEGTIEFLEKELEKKHKPSLKFW